jgi:glycosyltransferase involved in cell wall biosynthesis
VLWQILVCSIWHRTGLLTELLDALAEQMLPGVGVIVFRDNLQTGYGDKCQALLEASTAEYVSFIDDDDMIDRDFVALIVAALERRPDYVGFNVRHTEDGVLQVPVIHSLEYPGWHNTPELLTRDIAHFNPIRRELALLSRWYGGNGADRQWAEGLRERCCVHTQEYIPLELLHYRHVMADTFEAPRVPLSAEPPLKSYGFVTHL